MNALFKHQEEGLRFLEKRRGCGALIWEPGCAKTRTVIEYVKKLRETDPLLRALVVCSISLIERVWMDEIKKYSSFTFRNVRDDGFPKAHETPEDFFIVNWETIRSRRNEQKKELNQNLVDLRALIAKHPFLAALDESTKIKAYDSTITKTMLDLAPHFKHRIIMSGTPTPNSLLEWWSQINFVEPYVLGSSYHQFKNTYSYIERNGQQIPQGAFLKRAERQKMFKTGAREVISPANEKKIMERVSPYCMVVQKKDCLDLPEQIDLYRQVEMNPKQARVYRDMKEDLVAYLTDLFEDGVTPSAAVAQNALTKVAKLREATSGFIIDDQGKEVDLGSSPKLAALEDIVEDCEGQPVIVWGNYKWELRQIAALLEKHGPVSLLYGETSDKAGAIEAFQKGDTRFFVAHPLSAAHGLTLVNCSMQVFFSLSYSSEQYLQARARTHRPGQTQKCVYEHILAKDSIDQEILAIVQGKKTAQQMILDMIPRRVAA